MNKKMIIKNLKTIKLKAHYMMILIFVFFSTSATASSSNTIQRRIKSLGQDLGAFGSFMMLVIGVGGVILLFMGIWSLKKKADDPRETLAKPITMIIAGGLMSGFVALQTILATSITGSGVDNNRLGRFNANDLK